MRLKTLRLHGFKSFADRTTLEFRDGVTAIVGSNGCGKSNIADSIRWVLGEQRASAIRGAKMEEVIFQGTARRRPLNFAEVSLLFDNDSGRVPVPQTELEVSRKVFREGGSEYSLNRAACRLRDIQGLLRDTGLGANAYAIIEASMIETLLSDRAEERRALFEEAAGIGRYKDSRHAASRRLESAEADLTRLDDLIAEVESKVRSLSRQKRKAERYRELQSRRLDLEIAIAREEIGRLDESLARLSAERERLDQEERIAAAARSSAELELEERRLEASELGRQRSKQAGVLDDIRARLDARERAVLVASERRNNAEARLKQLVEERGLEQAKALAAKEELSTLERLCAAAGSELETARVAADAKAKDSAEYRDVLAAARGEADAASGRARELARDIAGSEGDRAAVERRGREARRRHEELALALERLINELAGMTGQTELWETRSDEIRAGVEAAREEVAAAREEVSVLTARELRAREELRSAEDLLSRTSAHLEAREGLERSYEGFAPAVAAIMAQRERFPGVHAPLADYIQESGPAGSAAAVERYLGSLLQALVVEDLATARAIRAWFRSEWTEGGGLVLLPLEALRSRLGASADVSGRRWVDELLSPIQVVEGDPLAEYAPGVSRIGSSGEVVDHRGVIRIVEVGEGQGILAARETLSRLREEAAQATRLRDRHARSRDELRAALREAEERLVLADEKVRHAEGTFRSLQIDAAAHHDRRARLLQERERIEREMSASSVEADEADQRLLELETRLQELAAGVSAQAELEAATRDRLAEADARWDSMRQEEAEARVVLAQTEARWREMDRRRESVERTGAAAMERIAALEREALDTQALLESLVGQNESASGEIEELFSARDNQAGALALLDARLAEVDSDLAEIGERVRIARRREMEAAEQRHQAELQIADQRSNAARAKDRIEAEWGRPWAALMTEASVVEGDVDLWRGELRATSEQLEALGPVNMLAVDEHAEEDRRLEFLLGQRADLVAARDDLLAAIRQINRTAREVFQSTFEAVRANFKRTFESLFEGGNCDIWLAAPDDPLESAVEIQASPLGKRTQRIHLLSGGERTLTALALLFALYLVKPSPFCVLDEIDAPLDESNVGRFLRLLDAFKNETQFIVITHNPRTMEAADWVYGVTMEDPGVSSIVGVELLGAWSTEGAAAARATV